MGSKTNPDIKQFEDIVGQYQDRLFQFAFMRIGKREDAEDLLQDVFVAFFRFMKSGHEIKNLEQYMYYSISNACADYFRKQKESMLPLFDTIDDIDDNDRDIYEEYKRVNKLLEDLPPEQAETVRLKCYDNLTFRQIADLQKTVEATVKSRYRYAINYIKQKFNLGYGKGK